jgi:hypothetical protein
MDRTVVVSLLASILLSASATSQLRAVRSLVSVINLAVAVVAVVAKETTTHMIHFFSNVKFPIGLCFFLCGPKHLWF